ncbi:MAG: hypothetical protein ACR2PX_16055 [Endozoicomonas sp.]|uniref:hypothetical protein n=1 Tax=Endozoicomonas sp. TaxID=1892382 RepID=UPI003D9AF881
MTSKPLFSLLGLPALLTVFSFQCTFAFEEPENITLSSHGLMLSEEKVLLGFEGFDVMTDDTLTQLTPRHSGWLKLYLSLDDIQGNNIVFPDGSIFPIDTSMENDLIFWLEDRNVQSGSGHFVRLSLSSDSDALLHSIVSIDGRKIHLGAIKQEQERSNKDSLQLENLKLSAVVITSSDEGRSPATREDDLSSLYSDYPDNEQDTPYSKKKPPPTYGNAQIPLFNQLDAISEIAGSIGSPWLIRDGSKIDLAIKQLPQMPLSKQFYLDSIVDNLTHSERMVQVNMLFVPLTPQSPDAATAANLEALETIMNWLAKEVVNADEMYSIHRALLQTQGDFQGKDIFLKNNINKKGQLRTKKLLQSWKNRMGEKLPDELKRILQRMGYRFSPEVSSAFDEIVATQDMVKGTKIVAYQPKRKKVSTLNSRLAAHQLAKEYRPPLPGVTYADSFNFYSVAQVGQGGQQLVAGPGIRVTGLPNNVRVVQAVSDPSKAQPERRLGKDGKLELPANEEEEDK